MDGFQVFNKGNRQKFLDQAKKKKQQAIIQNRPTLDSQSIIKIQKHIRRFLSAASQASQLFQLSCELQTLNLSQLANKLNQVQTSNSFLFNYFYKFLISRAQERFSKNRQFMQDEGYLECLGKYSNKIGPIFGRLLRKDKIFWLRKILKYNADFTFAYLSKGQVKQISEILGSNMQIFIEIVGNISSNSLVSELITLVGSVPLKKSLQAPLSESNLPLTSAYDHLLRATINIKIRQLGEYPLFFINTFSYLTTLIHKECLLTIMQKYKIDPSFLKAEGELLQEVISQKQQWQCFLDYLNLNNPFNASIVDWFINLPTFQQSLSVCNYLEILLHLIPLEDSFNISMENLMVCMKKFSQWIKVHEIVESQEQQTLLLPYLYLINIKFFKMTDKQFINFVKKQGQVLQRILKDKFIKIIYKVILNSKANKKIEQITKICINLVEEIYNKIFRTGVLSTEIFVNEIMSKKLVMYTQAKSDNQIVEFVRKFPFIFSLKDRARKFHEILRQYRYMNMDDDQYYEPQGSGRVKIRRGHEFDDAFNALGNKNIRKGFQISFIDQFGSEERGVDAGGLTKQFINRVLKAAFQSERGMFVQNSQKQLLPHPQKSQDVEGIIAQHYQFIGKMIGKALYQGITIGPKFCGPVLNAIIGKKNNFDDLSKIDKHLYNSLAYIKTMKEDASQLCLTFQFEDEILNKKVNLKKNGHKIKVTNENKDEFISLLANYKVNKLLQFQSRHIRRGLKKVINSEWLFMFNYEELNYLISGSGEIKVHELRNYTKYVGYQANDITIKMFWSVVMEFDEETKSNLLMFVTACPRPSFLGFEQLSPPFTIARKNDANSLPISHTCMNLLELPDYRDRQLLEQKLKLAINSGSGFDIA